MYCKHCGARLRDGAEFCDACGSHTQQPAQRQPNYSEPPRPPHNNNGVIIAVIALIAVVAVVAIISFTVLTRGQQQAQLAEIQQEQSSQAETQQQTEQTQDTTSEKEKSAEDTQDSGTTTIHNNYYYYDTHHRQDDYYDNVESNGYLWPTDTEYISSSDLSGLGQDTVAAIRNEIYARHGYAFTTNRWKNYFSAKSWYVRDESCTESNVTSRLNSIEKANVNTIVAYEESMGWR